MSEGRFDEMPGDAALAREIEEALSVDPSPEFVVRVRMRLASEPVPSSAKRSMSWMTAAAGVAATALVVAIYVGRTPSTDGSGASASAATGMVATDTSPAPRQMARREASAQAGSGSRVAERPARVPTTEMATGREVRRHAFPEVLVSTAEVRGFETLLGRVQRGELTITVDEQPAEDLELTETADLVIAPITIRPLDSATVTEGAEE